MNRPWWQHVLAIFILVAFVGMLLLHKHSRCELAVWVKGLELTDSQTNTTEIIPFTGKEKIKIAWTWFKKARKDSKLMIWDSENKNYYNRIVIIDGNRYSRKNISMTSYLSWDYLPFFTAKNFSDRSVPSIDQQLKTHTTNRRYRLMIITSFKRWPSEEEINEFAIDIPLNIKAIEFNFAEPEKSKLITSQDILKNLKLPEIEK